MGLRVKYTEADGNTVPYPPLFDHVRRNYGFIDTRGHPDRVASIPEARESAGLARLLQTLAGSGTQLVSLGCDLGKREYHKARAETRREAGGYVQVVSALSLDWDYELKFLRFVGRTIEEGLRVVVGKDLWEIHLQLSPVLLRLDDEVERRSIWIWFHAKASTFDRAFASRERLLEELEKLIGGLSPDQNWQK